MGSDEALLEIEGPAPPPVAKVYDFYVTTVGGMEEVALGELKDRLKHISGVHVERGRRLGRIFFRYERSPKVLLDLRSVENVFALLADIRGVTVGQPGLLRIAQRVGLVDLLPAAALHDVLFGPKERPGFQLACTTGKGHRFSTSELHQVVQTVLTLKYAVDDVADHPYRLQMRVHGNRALFGLQLSSWRERLYREVRVDRELPPSAAYGLARLAQVRRRDVCVDIRCGGGVCLIEGAQDVKPRLLLGCEGFPQVLEGARANARAAGVDICFAALDAVSLPLRTGCVDRVFCNLIRRRGEPVFDLLLMLCEMRRVLRSEGRAVVVSEDRNLFERALENVPGLNSLSRQPLHLQGRHCDIYVLEKSDRGQTTDHGRQTTDDRPRTTDYRRQTMDYGESLRLSSIVHRRVQKLISG